MGILAGKRIVLGVGGSIANYKVIELARQLTVAGALVDVLMTEEATRFVTPLTFQSLTYRPVYTEMWSTVENAAAHVKLGEEADIVVVVPATAHTLASIAHGLADTMILTTILATRAPVMLVPAMNVNMWHNSATQANVALLKQRGLLVLEPDEGMLASGITGRGRLPAIERVEAELQALLGRTYGTMAGRKVVVTAGGTHEPLDPVRFLGNRASGQMGYALAAAARDQGAAVTLISGPATAAEPFALDVVRVETAQQMHDAVHAHVADADLLVMNAAVADYRPAQAVDHKLKKTDEQLTIALERTPDILQSLVDIRRPIKIGFAAETNDLLAYAADKLDRKKLDLIVANDAVSSIGQPEIEVTLLDADGGKVTLPRAAKGLIAEQLLEHVLQRWPERLGRTGASVVAPSMRLEEE
ncbi:MAG: bifunctional phosphopantothenoylcysteine decarboxylase/phosphopantothenate--cysteine ligase CoaBC [Chloroflexota bacterium]|nr:bifunctional phosphopantothenoylcysteine decarboxylase/phosphopantothenate--cysteine ligase CoaBC [Chloroflexota bacterium]PLS77371.1 MAG: bifunctional phosphopantothenoylcysteine decarboxylase/phosphopantothenate--cysteine ligase CoaBC [Chloroflexota bacterium]